MKRGSIIVILLILIIAGLFFYYRRTLPKKTISKAIVNNGKEKILTYRLPTNPDPDVFGTKFWAAFHNLSQELPCPGCRKEWESFMIFAHDYKNFDLSKKIYAPENFEKWLLKLCQIKDEYARKKK